MRRTALVACVVLAVMGGGVEARHHHPRLVAASGNGLTVSQPAVNAVAPVDAPQINTKCLAACAAKCAGCIYECDHAITGLTCKEECAAHAAECSAECILAIEPSQKPSPAVINSANIEAAFAELTASPIASQEVAVAAPQVNTKCLAACAAKCAGCIYECDHAVTGLTCKEECAAHAAECSAECILAPNPTPQLVDPQLAADMEAFASFKTQYDRSYESAEIEAHRFSIFQLNQRRAEELSKLNPTATFGVTRFSDLHPLEFKRQYLNFRPAVGDAAVLRQGVPVTQTANTTIPTSYDWRKPDQGRPVGVTAVKDQGQCGSCWAFSATEALESAHILAGNTAVALAPEQTVDCDTVDGGCNGGDTVTAYSYMKKAGGVMSEKSYPYQAGVSGSAGTCAFKAADVQAKLNGFTYATPGCTDDCAKQDEAKLKDSLYTKGPVSICVDASPWQTYTSGILTPASGCARAYDQLDHCVQLVGYGVDAKGHAYWSVRNSWATSWGEEGYIRLSYGTNTCGVADEATQVIV